MPAYGAIDSDHYNPKTMSFTAKRTHSSAVHVDFIKQDSEGADEVWRQFILDKSRGFTRAGASRIDESIRTYVWAILGSQGQAHTAILRSGAVTDAQNAFMADAESAISSPVSIQADVERYQNALQYTRSKVNFSFGTGLYMAPEDMLLRVGQITGYNNNIQISTAGQPQGLNLGINTSDAPPDATNDPNPPPHPRRQETPPHTPAAKPSFTV